MATAADIITAAFIKVGIGVPTTAQTASALISLNNMISLLGAEMLTPVVVSESFALVVTDPEYTIGSGGQWDTVRPLAVRRCFLRDDDNNDTPIKILSSRNYNGIPNKSYDGTPNGLYFLPEYPLAKIIFNGRPTVGVDAFFEFVKNFTEFATTATSVVLPPEYKEALVYNLAVSLGEDWDRVVSKTIFAQAIRTREVIDRMNASARVVPVARFDGLGIAMDYPFAGGTYDIVDGGSF